MLSSNSTNPDHRKQYGVWIRASQTFALKNVDNFSVRSSGLLEELIERRKKMVGDSLQSAQG